MKKTANYSIVFLLVPFLLFQCTKNEGIFNDDRKITFEDGVLECKECVYFAYLVALDQNSLFVSGNDELFCLEYTGTDWEVTQLLKNEGQISSITPGGDHLFLGIILPDGDGVVKVFEKQSGLWTEVQELSSGSEQDNFGAVVACDEEHLLIGADGVESKGIYFFQKKEGMWSFKKEYDTLGLGRSVALQGNYAYAGTRRGFYSFYFDGDDWSRKDYFPFLPVDKLCLEGSQLFVRSGTDFQPLRAFEVQMGQVMEERPVDYDQVKDLNVNMQGDVIKMQGNYLAAGIESWDMDSRGGLLLLEYEDGAWGVEETFLPPAEASDRMAYTFALSEDWVAIGDNFSYNGKVFLYQR